MTFRRILFHGTNQAVKRNIARFPERYRFQLTEEEYANLKSQNVISSSENNYGGRRKLPYVFSEQGIAMLSSVLHSDIAVQVSLRIMDTFVEMRRFIANNQLLFEKISSVELKQLEYVFMELHDNPNLTVEELAASCGLSHSGTAKILLVLKQRNLIERAGNRRNGYWKIKQAISE